MREDVGHHAILAGVIGEPARIPFLPGIREIPEQLRRVDPFDVLVGVWLGRDDSRIRALERIPNPLRAGRNLGSRRANAHPDLPAGLVQTVAIAPDHRHREAHAARIPHVRSGQLNERTVDRPIICALTP
jgi:hypothetical protein